MNIPSTMPELKRQRLNASVRAHGVMAGIMFGMQLFIDGTGRAPHMALNAIYIAALPTLLCAALLCVLVSALRRRHDMRGLPDIYRTVLGRFWGGVACLFTGLLFLVDVLGALAMLGPLVGGRLLSVQNAQSALLPALIVLFIVILTASEGLERLAFLVRRSLPLLLLALSLLLAYKEPVSNLFPLLGRSLALTGKSAIYSTGAAACTLSLGFLPAGLAEKPPASKNPGLKPLLLGGAIACLMLFFVALSVPYTVLEGTNYWTELLIHAGSHISLSGISYLLITLLECFALLLALGGSLFFAAQSFAYPMGRRLGIAIVFIAALGEIAAVSLCGNAFVFAVLPLRFLPALVLVTGTLMVDFMRTRRKKRRKDA